MSYKVYKADFESGNVAPGARFMLDKDTPAIYIGPGGFRSIEYRTAKFETGDVYQYNVPNLKFNSTMGHVIAYFYKREWHMITLDSATSEENHGNNGFQIGWPDKVLTGILNRDKHVRAD